MVLARSSRPLTKSIWRLFLFGLLGASTWVAYRYAQEPVLDIADYEARVERAMRLTPLIDGHNDLPYLLRLELQNKIYDKSTFTFKDRAYPCPNTVTHLEY